jgi:imidazolonepropionase-like amidohydrolase
MNMSNRNSRLVIKSGDVFDASTGTMKEGHTIVAIGNKIAWCGPDSAFDKETNDEIIDATGKTILPGMIDCHVHLESTATPQYEREYLRTTRAMLHYYALRNAQNHLIHGFTCLRDCGAYPDWGPSLRRIFDNCIIAGPRLLVANLPIAQWGNQEAIGPLEVLEYERKLMEVKTGADGVKHAVRDRKHSGADFIKTLTTGGVLHGIESKVGTSLFVDEELSAIVEEAHRLGMHVACHAHGRQGIYKAAIAGIDTIEHGSYIDEEIAKLMIQKGLYLIPTQIAGLSLAKPEILEQMPPEVAEKTKTVVSAVLENHKMAFNKGVRFAIGTDAGTPGNHHGGTASEIRNMVENVGMTTTQALQAATIESAKAIKKDDMLGSIEQGKFADLVVCDLNPLEEIATLQDSRNFAYIIKDGKIMVKQGQITYFK